MCWFYGLFIYGIFINAPAAHSAVIPHKSKESIYLVQHNGRPFTKGENTAVANSSNSQYVHKIPSGNVKNSKYRIDSNYEDIKSFSYFIRVVVETLNKYDNTDLEDFVTVLTEELKKYHYRGCKFHEVTENDNFRQFIGSILFAISDKPANIIKHNFLVIIDKINERIKDKAMMKLIDAVNSLYKNESFEKFYSFLVKIDAYRQKSPNKLRLVKIVREGIRSIIFDHYTYLNYITRNTLKSILNEYGRLFIELSRSILSLTKSENNMLNNTKSKKSIDITTQENIKITYQSTDPKIFRDSEYLITTVQTKYKPQTQTRKEGKEIVEKEFYSKIKAFTTSKSLKEDKYLTTTGKTKYRLQIHIRGDKNQPIAKVTNSKITQQKYPHFKETKMPRHMLSRSIALKHLPYLTGYKTSLKEKLGSTTRLDKRLHALPWGPPQTERQKLFRTKLHNVTADNYLYRIEWLERELRVVRTQRDKYADIIKDLESLVLEKNMGRFNIKNKNKGNSIGGRIDILFSVNNRTKKNKYSGFGMDLTKVNNDINKKKPYAKKGMKTFEEEDFVKESVNNVKIPKLNSDEKLFEKYELKHEEERMLQSMKRHHFYGRKPSTKINVINIRRRDYHDDFAHGSLENNKSDCISQDELTTMEIKQDYNTKKGIILPGDTTVVTKDADKSSQVQIEDNCNKR